MPAPKVAVLNALKCEYWPISRTISTRSSGGLVQRRALLGLVGNRLIERGYARRDRERVLLRGNLAIGRNGDRLEAREWRGGNRDRHGEAGGAVDRDLANLEVRSR